MIKKPFLPTIMIYACTYVAGAEVLASASISKNMLDSLYKTASRPVVRKVIKIDQPNDRVFVQTNPTESKEKEELRNHSFKPVTRKIIKIDPDKDVVYFEKK